MECVVLVNKRYSYFEVVVFLLKVDVLLGIFLEGYDDIEVLMVL